MNVEVYHDCILPRTILGRVISQSIELLAARCEFAEPHCRITRYRPAVAKDR